MEGAEGTVRYPSARVPLPSLRLTHPQALTTIPPLPFRRYQKRELAEFRLWVGTAERAMELSGVPADEIEERVTSHYRCAPVRPRPFPSHPSFLTRFRARRLSTKIFIKAGWLEKLKDWSNPAWTMEGATAQQGGCGGISKGKKAATTSTPSSTTTSTPSCSSARGCASSDDEDDAAEESAMSAEDDGDGADGDGDDGDGGDVRAPPRPAPAPPPKPLHIGGGEGSDRGRDPVYPSKTGGGSGGVATAIDNFASTYATEQKADRDLLLQLQRKEAKEKVLDREHQEKMVKENCKVQ